MKGPFSVTTARQSSGFMFWRVSTLWQRGIRGLLDPLGLTHTQFVLLASLRWLEKSSQADLSGHTGCDSMTVSSVVRTMAARGWVDRQDDDSDRRAKVLRITSKGTAIVDRAVPLVEAFDRQFFLDRLGDRKGRFLKDLDDLARGVEDGRPGSPGPVGRSARSQPAFRATRA
jgi:DNA-binding MarR family transcriptional regulator